MVDILRSIIIVSIVVLSTLTLSNLKHFQHTLDIVSASYEASFHLESPAAPRQQLSQKNDTILQHKATEVQSNAERDMESATKLAASSKKFNKKDSTMDSNATYIRTSIVRLNEDPPIDDGLPCLVHETIEIHAETNRVSDPSKTLLEQISTNAACGQLRRDWTYHKPTSRFAKLLEEHQTNCKLPLGTHYLDNTFGLGSHLALWGQALCNLHQAKYRMRSLTPWDIPWIWMDQQHCVTNNSNDDINIFSTKNTTTPTLMTRSPMTCYFPNSEDRCHDGDIPQTSRNVTDPRDPRRWCKLVKESNEIRAEFRAASTEFLFQKVSPIVIQEAKRQLGVIFADTDGVVPSDLITVHIRWGDKFWEMKLPKIEEYIDAIQALLASPDTAANVYLATEDPKAYNEFINAKPANWKVYADITLQEINAFRPPKGNRASWATKNTKGRAGLIALGSLLVAMEANGFVLTTKSNWSALMNHLRTNIIDPACGNCTRVVDLRPGTMM